MIYLDNWGFIYIGGLIRGLFLEQNNVMKATVQVLYAKHVSFS